MAIHIIKSLSLFYDSRAIKNNLFVVNGSYSQNTRVNQKMLWKDNELY